MKPILSNFRKPDMWDGKTGPEIWASYRKAVDKAVTNMNIETRKCSIIKVKEPHYKEDEDNINMSNI